MFIAFPSQDATDLMTKSMEVLGVAEGAGSMVAGMYRIQYRNKM
jgi:hypothetical protein